MQDNNQENLTFIIWSAGCRKWVLWPKKFDT